MERRSYFLHFWDHVVSYAALRKESSPDSRTAIVNKVIIRKRKHPMFQARMNYGCRKKNRFNG